jgi:hypothetical protein
MNKNLILICAGKDALHQRWEQLHLDHGFDLALLVYDGTVYDDPNSNAAKWNLHCAGMKFENIHRFLTEQDWSQYDSIGMIDDDVLTTPADIQAVFAMGRHHQFDLWSPAMGEGSYISHRATAQQPDYDFRISNVVEIMCPFWTRRALEACLPDFVDAPNKQGYGLEYSWEALLESHNGRTKFGGWVAIVDKYPMVHTKPVTQCPDISEPDTWHFRRKYGIEHLWVFNEQVLKGYKSNV